MEARIPGRPEAIVTVDAALFRFRPLPEPESITVGLDEDGAPIQTTIIETAQHHSPAEGGLVVGRDAGGACYVMQWFLPNAEAWRR